jgi:hypothetical protein
MRSGNARKINALADIEIIRPNGNTISKAIPCRIVGDKLYTMTRTFCINSKKKIAGIKGDTECKLIAYSTV